MIFGSVMYTFFISLFCISLTYIKKKHVEKTFYSWIKICFFKYFKFKFFSRVINIINYTIVLKYYSDVVFLQIHNAGINKGWKIGFLSRASDFYGLIETIPRGTWTPVQYLMTRKIGLTYFKEMGHSGTKVKIWRLLWRITAGIFDFQVWLQKSGDGSHRANLVFSRTSGFPSPRSRYCQTNGPVTGPATIQSSRAHGFV